MCSREYGSDADRGLPLRERIRYWRGLLRKEPLSDPRLVSGHLEEIRVALRDAIHELEEIRCTR